MKEPRKVLDAKTETENRTGTEKLEPPSYTRYLHSTCPPGRRGTASWSPWRTAARAWGWSWSYRCTQPVTRLLLLLPKPKFVHPVHNTVSSLWNVESTISPMSTTLPPIMPPPLTRVHCAGRLEGRPRPCGDPGGEAGGGRGLQGPGGHPQASAPGARGGHCRGRM